MEVPRAKYAPLALARKDKIVTPFHRYAGEEDRLFGEESKSEEI